jgi:DNA repair protein RadC
MRKNHSDKEAQRKRVDIVSIKMVREASVLYEKRKIASPRDAFELIKDFLKDEDREKFLAIYLNTKNEPTAIHTVSIGTINASLVHPREVFKGALMTNAASVIVAHNHPSNECNPSKEDIQITKRLMEAGKIIGIEVIDHIIVGDSNHYISLKERGDM